MLYWLEGTHANQTFLNGPRHWGLGYLEDMVNHVQRIEESTQKCPGSGLNGTAGPVRSQPPGGSPNISKKVLQSVGSRVGGMLFPV